MPEEGEKTRDTPLRMPEEVEKKRAFVWEHESTRARAETVGQRGDAESERPGSAMSTAQISTAQTGTEEIGTTKVGTAEIGTAQVGAAPGGWQERRRRKREETVG